MKGKRIQRAQTLEVLIMGRCLTSWDFSLLRGKRARQGKRQSTVKEVILGKNVSSSFCGKFTKQRFELVGARVRVQVSCLPCSVITTSNISLAASSALKEMKRQLHELQASRPPPPAVPKASQPDASSGVYLKYYAGYLESVHKTLQPGTMRSTRCRHNT